MVHKAPGLFVAAALAALAVEGGYCQAQDAPLPRAPMPIVAGGPADASPPPPPAPPSPSYVMPGYPPPVYPPQPPPPPVAAPASPAYQPPTDEGGWFFGVEADLIKPHIKNHLSGTVLFSDGSSDTIQVPQVEQDWTVAPRLEAGYRLPDNMGAVVFTYRFFDTSGRADNPNFDGFNNEGLFQSRMTLNYWDLDYVSEVWQPCAGWEFQGKVGIRLADVYFDSQVASWYLAQRESNSFFGAGPHVGVDLWRPIAYGFAVTSRVEGAVMVGRIGQGFEETFLLTDGTLAGSDTSFHREQAVPMLNAQVGIGWAPLGGNHIRLSTGYEYEHWWAVGDAGDSHAELWEQGFYFRGEFNF